MNIASWAGVMASPFIGFYNATKYGLAGLTESMYYDLGLLDIHAVLAIPGITKTPLLTKTTGTALASLDIMPPEAQARYRPYLEHLARMNPDSMRMLLPPRRRPPPRSPRSSTPAGRTSSTTSPPTPSSSTASSPGSCRSPPGPR